jgi:hypothetical protein
MKKILIILLIVSSCCSQVDKNTVSKTEYLKIGFENGTESYITAQGNSTYEIMNNNLYDSKSCESTILARNITYFSIISKEEYGNATLKNNNPTPITEPIY